MEIRDLTLGGADGKPMLSHLSLKLIRGTFVALLGTETVSTRSLTELLMGFGRAGEGEVLIDGINLLDIHPQALARNVMWVDPAGPIWTVPSMRIFAAVLRRSTTPILWKLWNRSTPMKDFKGYPKG